MTPKSKKSIEVLLSKIKIPFSYNKKMSILQEGESNGGLVCDAVPDPPRREPMTSDNQNINRNQPSKESSDKSDSSSKKANKTNVKYVKPKKRKETLINPVTNSVTNINISSSSGIHIGNVTHNTINSYVNRTPNSSNDSATPPSRPPEESEEIKKMSSNVQNLKNSDLMISKEDIHIIKTHIGKGWKKFARKIDYSKGQIEQFLINYESIGIGEVVYQILNDWVQAFTKDATIGRAIQALWSSEEFECAERLAAYKLLQ